MLFMPVNFAAANLSFHPRACLVSIVLFFLFPSLSGGGKPQRGGAARSSLDGQRGLQHPALTFSSCRCCCFQLLILPSAQLQLGIKGFANCTEDASP